MAVNSVAVLGAGHGGCAAAADLGKRGYSVRLHARNAERLAPLRAQGGIEARGVAQGLGSDRPHDYRCRRSGSRRRPHHAGGSVGRARTLCARTGAADRRQPADFHQSGTHRRRAAFPSRAAQRRLSRAGSQLRDGDPDLHHADGGTGRRQHLQLHQAAAFRGAAGQGHRGAIRTDQAALSGDSAGEQRAGDRTVQPQRDLPSPGHDHECGLDPAYRRRFPVLSRRLHRCGRTRHRGRRCRANGGRKGLGHSGHSLHRRFLPSRAHHQGGAGQRRHLAGMPGERAEQDHQVSLLAQPPLCPRRRRLRARSDGCARPACRRPDADHRRADPACGGLPSASTIRATASRSNVSALPGSRRPSCCDSSKTAAEQGVPMEHELLRKLRSAMAAAGL